ncbi:MAG: hypothetical protein AB4290_29665 [Spirulina sp.]
MSAAIEPAKNGLLDSAIAKQGSFSIPEIESAPKIEGCATRGQRSG